MAEKSPNWGTFGGSHPMHSKTGANEQKPGVSSQEGNTALNKSMDPDSGGAGVGFYASATTNKDYAGTQAPGTSGPTKSGGNAKFAEGGKTPMFGNRGSLASRGGHSTTG